MPWVRLDDHFDEHPKIAALSDSAFRLWTNALAYANRTLSDGVIPALMLRRLSTAAKPDKDAAALVKAGLWETVPDGYQIHDFHDYQPTKEAVLAERETTRQRVANWRERKKSQASNAAGNGVTNGVSNSGVTASPYPYPVPKPEKVVARHQTSGNEQPPGAQGRGGEGSPGAGAREGGGFAAADFFDEEVPLSISDAEQTQGTSNGVSEGAPVVDFASDSGSELEVGTSSPGTPNGSSVSIIDATSENADASPDPVLDTALYLESLTAEAVAAFRATHPDDAGLALFDMRAKNRAQGATI